MNLHRYQHADNLVKTYQNIEDPLECLAHLFLIAANFVTELTLTELDIPVGWPQGSAREVTIIVFLIRQRSSLSEQVNYLLQLK